VLKPGGPRRKGSGGGSFGPRREAGLVLGGGGFEVTENAAPREGGFPEATEIQLLQKKVVLEAQLQELKWFRQ